MYKIPGREVFDNNPFWTITQCMKYAHNHLKIPMKRTTIEVNIRNGKLKAQKSPGTGWYFVYGNDFIEWVKERDK